MPFEIEFEDPRIGFASAHFIIGHDKCGRLHGHNYFLKVVLKGELDDQHMVLDYGDLKEQLGKLTKPLDHSILIPEKATGLEVEEKEDSIEIITCNKRYLFPKEDIFFLPIPATTSEELAKYFYLEMKKIWPNFSIKVNIEEAPGASATFSD
ncbi:MAG TPA: 6-carboxytetrahydropterin synthase [candidate division Zixibacteria bacterium]|nr:6-carboxytetrahydropterin synthase [candidate division Zixibacteria bacterium]